MRFSLWNAGIRSDAAEDALAESPGDVVPCEKKEREDTNVNILMNLISLYHNLPSNSTYRTVAERILANLPRMRNASIYEAEEITASSRSTISRMIRLMGYDTYTEFRHQLSSALDAYSYYNWSLPVTPQTTPEEITSLAGEQLRQSAALVEKSFTPELMEKVAGALHRAERVRFYDLPSTSSYFLVENLAMDRKQTRQYSLYPDMLRDAEELDENSVVISYPVVTPDMMDLTPVYTAARNNGALLILGCDRDNHYCRQGDIFLFPQGTGRLPFPMARRHAMEMFYLVLSEFYRKTYL